MITTKRLFLMPATQKMLDAAVDQNWDELSSLLGGVYFADNWTHFPEALVFARNYMLEHPGEQDWWMYFIIQGLDARVAGTCGFKGKPTLEGSVEIGYEVAERYQNQGIATEAAAALVKKAFSHPEVTNVIAHTLPEENASVQVLRHLSFELDGTATDDEVGSVWRWRKQRDLIV
jgi:RimJ/RimL family protein N-acetyltransferase